MTGPWDFVQDIRTYPELTFPRDESIVPNVKQIGGHNLNDVLLGLCSRKSENTLVEVLSPSDLNLFHRVICVHKKYMPDNTVCDLCYFVAKGQGRLDVEKRSAQIKQGDIFLIKSGMAAELEDEDQLVLYEFGVN